MNDRIFCHALIKIRPSQKFLLLLKYHQHDERGTNHSEIVVLVQFLCFHCLRRVVKAPRASVPPAGDGNDDVGRACIV